MLLSKLTKKLTYSIILSKSQKLQSQQILQRIKKRLQELMNNQKKILTLSKTFQIFPSFFNFGIINQMIQSQFMEEYLNYIVIMKNNKDIHSKDQYVNQICQSLRIGAIQDQRMLEVYINYVKRTKDLSQSQIIMEIFDIRYPQNWFKSRQMGQRKFIYHYGPTNSGKTYSAINQLKNITQDQKGVYMAPLRLLAWQTHKKLGKCNLITGQEKDYQNSNITSCTIEAVKINQLFDVAIIDQIQMIGDKSRGWSWTAPILGLRANKIHLCGDQRALSLVAKLVQKSGGTLQQKSYTRLNIRPGDCLIQFSSQKLYKLRDLINQQKNPSNPQSKTAIIYGKMPPACRKDQAQKFNNGQLPYLVASDAIGMGLNLNIRRIIFINLMKLSHDKVEKTLEDHQIRQIAGRAGRGYGHGYVQCVSMEMRDKVQYALRNVSKVVEKCNQKQQVQQGNQPLTSPSLTNTQTKTNSSSNSSPPIIPQPTSTPFTPNTLTPDQQRIHRAGIFFPISIIQRIKLKMQRILGYQLKTSQTIRLITNLSKQNKQLYFVQYNEQLLELSDLLENQKLNFHIHCVFAKIPIPNNSSQIKNVVLEFARQFKRNGVVRMPEFIVRDYEDQYSKYMDLSHIKILQDHYLIAQAYTWLWNHLQLYFPYNNLSNNIKQAICKKMNKLLSMPLLKKSSKKKIKRQRRSLFTQKKQQQQQALLKSQEQIQKQNEYNEDNEDNDVDNDNDNNINNDNSIDNDNNCIISDKKNMKQNGNWKDEGNKIKQSIGRQRKIDTKNRGKSKNIRLS